MSSVNPSESPVLCCCCTSSHSYAIIYKLYVAPECALLYAEGDYVSTQAGDVFFVLWRNLSKLANAYLKLGCGKVHLGKDVNHVDKMHYQAASDRDYTSELFKELSEACNINLRWNSWDCSCVLESPVKITQFRQDFCRAMLFANDSKKYPFHSEYSPPLFLGSNRHAFCKKPFVSNFMRLRIGI